MPDIDPLKTEPGQDLEIDLFRPEYGPGVAALFRTVYGEDYPQKVYYQPEALAAENAAGRIVSIVARTPRGEVVGHSAIFQTAPNPALYEVGSGLVLPAYRNTSGVFARMIAHGFDVVPKHFGAGAIWGDAVLNHPFSQRAARSMKAFPMALQIDLMPASAYAKERSAGGRVGSLVTINIFRPAPQTVFVPAAYREALEFLYNDLEDERELLASTEILPQGTASIIQTQYFAFARVARFSVAEIGDDFFARFEQEEQSARDQGSIVFQAWLNSSRPCLGRAVDWLADRGYFLSGALPYWFGPDAFVMQKMSHRPHWEGIVIEWPRGEEILKRVRRDWEDRAGGSGPER
ncbi:MAG: hypothetical protein KKB20_10955 [Proteobacteria bacterium]|nr:hypothetical protein [Pseudomonadota bacterium]